MKLLKEYIRNIISESIDEQDLAAYVTDYEGGKKVVIYDSFLFRTGLTRGAGRLGDISAPEMISRLNDLDEENIIKGYLQVGPPPATVENGGTQIDTGECYGAWMVYKSAGPGMGKYVYGLGYALSPSGLLIPDRMSVSPSARGGWKKQASKRGKKFLDNITLPPKSRRTPDDPSDDCAPQDEEGLNYAFEGSSDDSRMLALLTAEHERMMNTFGRMSQQAESWLDMKGGKFFWKNFGVGA